MSQLVLLRHVVTLLWPKTEQNILGLKRLKVIYLPLLSGNKDGIDIDFMFSKCLTVRLRLVVETESLQSVEGPQKHSRNMVVFEAGGMSERLSEKERDSVGVEQINWIHIDTARWKNAISALQRLRHGCFVMIHFWNPPQLLTQMEKLQRHLADEPHCILIITPLCAHTLFRLVFNPFREKSRPIISIITTCSLPMEHTNTATLKQCPQMHLFTLVHKRIWSTVRSQWVYIT